LRRSFSARRLALLLALWCPWLDQGAAAAQAASSRRPNVVVIMVDSMGYGDSEPYGGTDIQTPQLRRFAREGVRLTDGYANGPVCTPTRAALLTGRYQQRFGLEWFLTKERKDAGLPASDVSIARVLRQRGYRTAAFGKWHLGYTAEFGPNAHGFEEFFGHLDFSIDYFTHRNIDGEPDLWENGTLVERAGYMTDLITERSVAFIERHKDEPFFLYVAYNAMVPPVQPPDRPDDVRTSANWGQGGRAEYARMVERMDDGVGRILDALERSGSGRDTLSIFTNDHGGQWYSRRAPLFHGFDPCSVDAALARATARGERVSPGRRHHGSDADDPGGDGHVGRGRADGRREPVADAERQGTAGGPDALLAYRPAEPQPESRAQGRVEVRARRHVALVVRRGQRPRGTPRRRLPASGADGGVPRADFRLGSRPREDAAGVRREVAPARPGVAGG
jgi:hypothetical protein